jgi:tRNA threonylcarbamoyladenosine biosynthesis protein TsaB
MKWLLLNTCGEQGMVALAESEAIVAVETLPGRGSSEQLLPAMRSVFAAAGWTVARLDAIAVVYGPGSFTGVRVGLSAAKGLCEGLGVPMVALSRLALLAAQASGADVLALLDAGRGEFYAGLAQSGLVVREELLRQDQVRLLPHSAAVACEPKVVAALAGLPVHLVSEPGPEAILRLARERAHAAAWTDVATVDANYLRRTDAELLVERRAANPQAESN